MIVRGGYDAKCKTEEIRHLERDITSLNQRFMHLSTIQMKTDVTLENTIKDLLTHYGPRLWPPLDPSKPEDRVWLFKASSHDAPEYTIDLVYTLHRERWLVPSLFS